MVKKLNHLRKVLLCVSLIVVVMFFGTLTGTTTNAEALSPEFDLSRIYLKNPLGHKVNLEIGPEGDTLLFEGLLSKQVNLTDSEIQAIAMQILVDMGINLLEFKEMQAEVRASLAPPKAMTPAEREEFIADLTSMMKLPGYTGEVLGLFNKVAGGKTEEEAIKESIIEKVLEEAGPIGALDAVERSWQNYNKRWQNFESANKSKRLVDEFYQTLQRRIDDYKAEKGYKGTVVFKSTATRTGFSFLNSDDSQEGNSLNTQLWTLEIMLDQKTVTGEDTLEGSLNGELGSLAGHYEGSYKLTVKTKFKYFYMFPFPNKNTQDNLESLADNIVHICDSVDFTDRRTYSSIIPKFDENYRATIDWELQGLCEADLFENGSMVFGVLQDRIESIYNNFTGLSYKHTTTAERFSPVHYYSVSVSIPCSIKAIPNQKKLYIDYAEGPYNESHYNLSHYFYTDYKDCAILLVTELKALVNAGGWIVDEYFWNYSIHNPWEGEDGTIAPMILSLVEED